MLPSALAQHLVRCKHTQETVDDDEQPVSLEDAELDTSEQRNAFNLGEQRKGRR